MNDWIWEKHFENRSDCATYWFNKSVHLRRASRILWDSTQDIYDSDATYRMLMGMSFELIFKAHVIAQNKEIAKTHKLVQLASDSGFKLNSKEKHIFTSLSGYIYWEGRYPVPLSSTKSPGPDGIKAQWEPFISYYSGTQNPLQEEPELHSRLEYSDFDYDGLTKIWKKYSSDFIGKYM